jgi:hypothetical protein
MLVLTTALAAACAGTLDPMPRPAPGYAARSDAAGQRAEDHNRSTRPPDSLAGSEGYTCGDTVMSDQLTSGGQRIVQSIPCWDTGEERIAHAEYIAQLRDENAAESDQKADASRVEAERAACRGLSPRELEHTPFSHHREIAEVIPHRDAGTLRGVRIIWKPVPGLTAAWMRQAIACHRARFERLGESAIYFPDDPTLVAHANVTVEQHKNHLEVLIETTDETTSQVALERAMELVRPRTAGR